MLASSAKEPFNDPDWIFETKLDGYRAVAVIDATGKARIWWRNRLPLEPKFPTTREAVEELHLRSTILDGEIVALDEEGIPRFQLLQKWQKRLTAPVAYVLFDLLWDNGRDLTGKSVIQRRERLEEIFTPVPGIQVGGFLEKRGVELFKLAKEKGLEGVIAKKGKARISLAGAHQIGSRLRLGHSKSSLSVASPKAKEAESILERCFWEHTETGSFVSSDIQEAALQKRD